MDGSKVAKNASWIICVQVVKALLSLAISMISARYLGPQNYGIISYAESLVSFLSPLMYLGLREILVQEIINCSEKEGETLGTSICLSFLSALICIIGLHCFVSISNRGETETIIVCTIYSFLLVFQAMELIQYWFQANLLSKYSSIIALIAYLLKSSYRIFLLVTAKSVRWFAVSNSIDFFIIASLLLITYKRLGGKKLVFSPKRAKGLIGRSRHYLFSTFMQNTTSNIGSILLKAMVSVVATGYYSAAAIFINMTNFVYTAIVDSFRPVIFEKKKTDEVQYEDSVCQLYSIMLYLTIIQNLAICLLATFIIKLIYGEAYMPASNVLRVLVWGMTFTYLGTVRNIWMLAEELQKYLVVINTFGAIINIGLNLILIPRFGVIGAAYATLSSQFFINIVIPNLIKPVKRSNLLLIKSINPVYIKKLARKMLKKRSY